ncbi:copper chaperone PCu(A)C [Roseicella aerolata]|uniref:Copper chaperone PCu(A)C n=1 Tax=Roseicella aerolata TaxID=2883479 RepID=A0A9X1IEX1_9PROT|nr:copper chaperone PCu(A)C [Roseicella aerolata]MCB4823429.1 copper chaperone PCu(A)C [Roseicella aerolata]
MHRRLFLASPLLLAFPAAAQHAPAGAGDLAIARPWTRAAGQGGTGAGFLAISNRGAAGDRLVAASSPVARVTELHTHIRDGEVMRMRPVEGIDIPPGQIVTLQPGGLHLMLIGLNQPLRQGETVPLTLRFARAGEVRVDLVVEAAGARGPGGHRH